MLFKRILNKKGMSLIEVLVAAGLMMIVAMGMTGMITSMSKEQNNQIRLTTLRELKTRFQFLITDQNSWNATLQKNAAAPYNNPLAICLTTKANCNSAAASMTDLVIHDGAGNPFFTPPAFGAVPGAGSPGFTDKGANCNNFNGNLGAGVDACPISYKVAWEPICTGTCKNPLVRVTVRLIFNPSDSAQAGAISVGNITGGTGWTNDTVAANTGKYDVVIKRSPISVNKAFMLSIFRANGGAGGGPGGGRCAGPGSWTTRGDTSLTDSFSIPNPAWDEGVNDDPFDLVSTNAAGAVIMKAGTYSCKISAVGWAVNTFSIRMVDATLNEISGSLGSSNASTQNWAQGTATSNPTLSVPADNTTYYVQQSCSTPYDPLKILSTDQRYNMGIPSSPYTERSVMATISCTQTN